MHQGEFEQTITTAVRALSAVSDLSDIQYVPSIRKGNELSRAIGLGAMNLHGFLASERIHYGSEESIDFTDFYFMLVNYYSLKASCDLAKERSPFFGFEKSKYATGEYFDYYLNRHHEPVTQRIRELFDSFGIDIPTREDWANLKKEVMKHGLYNAYRLAVAPTGSISYVNYATSSIHPIAMRMERRDEEKLGSVYAPAPYMNDDNIEYYSNAYELGYKPLIDVYAAATPHVDQGLSLTLFFTTDTTTGDLKDAYTYAYVKGIKTVYYVRVQKKELEGTEFDSCLSCEV